MTSDALLAEILRLPVEERLALLERVWDQTAASPAEVPMPDWHRTELDRRLDDPNDPADLSWNDIRDELEPPKG